MEATSSHAIGVEPRRYSAAFLAVFVGASVLIHVVGFAVMSSVDRPVFEKPRVIEISTFEVEKPKPPEPPPEPPKELPKPKVKPPPIKVAEVRKEPPPVEKEPAPPPPNEEAKEPPPKPVPIRVGISMSSTTTGGTFAAPIGNTVYGKVDDVAGDPKDVQNYSAPKYTPVYQVDTAPSVAAEVKVPYPDAAKRAGIEGPVILSITIDPTGTVVNVKILSGPGSGLNEAARDAIRRFKFNPAIKGGEKVSTEIKYTYTFRID